MKNCLLYPQEYISDLMERLHTHPSHSSLNPAEVSSWSLYPPTSFEQKPREENSISICYFLSRGCIHMMEIILIIFPLWLIRNASRMIVRSDGIVGTGTWDANSNKNIITSALKKKLLIQKQWNWYKLNGKKIIVKDTPGKIELGLWKLCNPFA